jgi:beta-lactamase regulating signal transducer with metallopeptidase domain
MNDALLQFGLTNLAASAAIIAVLLLRRPVRKRFGAGVAYAMWALPPLAAIASLLPPRIVTVAMPAFDEAAFDFGFEPAAAASAALPAAPEVAAPMDVWSVVAGLWMLGAVAMAAWLVWRQMRFMADVEKGVAGPAVIGFLRPRIIKPDDFEARFDAREQAVVIAHESVHIARQDARINAGVALVRCLWWFNPLVHLAAHAMRIDQEMACDAAVMRQHPNARRTYADALLKAQLAARPLPVGCYWPAGTEHPLTERIAMLKNAPGRGRRVVGAGLLAVLAFGAGFTAWAAMPAQTRFETEALRMSPETPLHAAAAMRLDLTVQPQQSRPDAEPLQEFELQGPQVETPTRRRGLAAPARPPLEEPVRHTTDAQRAASGGLLQDSLAPLFDSRAPVVVIGRVRGNGTTYTIGGEHRISLLIEAESVDGRGASGAGAGSIWRWVGGAPGGFTSMPYDGRRIVIRGYRAKDRSCRPACLMNGVVMQVQQAERPVPAPPMFYQGRRLAAPQSAQEQPQELPMPEPAAPYFVPVTPGEGSRVDRFEAVPAPAPEQARPAPDRFAPVTPGDVRRALRDQPRRIPMPEPAQPAPDRFVPVTPEQPRSVPAPPQAAPAPASPPPSAAPRPSSAEIPAFASQYDASVLVTLTGKVERIERDGERVILWISVVTRPGTATVVNEPLTVLWRADLGRTDNPQALASRVRALPPIGNVVSVRGYRGISGGPEATVQGGCIENCKIAVRSMLG